MRPIPSSSLLAMPLALSLIAGAGCVTRTVYVVNDDPRPSQAAPTAPAEAAAPYAESSGGGGYAEPSAALPVEQAAGIRYESDFYEPLSPYGRWVAYPGHGQVFVPAVSVVGAGFRPYTHGHWENTEYGYTWVDHHPFGWATGHYGRWFYDSSYGWAWVPGRTWAPAWVSWRSGGGYVGWAPMPPGAVFGGGYTVYDTSWSFVRYSSFGYGYVGSALIIGPSYRSCYTSTYPSRETYVVYGRSYYRGPDEHEIVRGGGRVIHRPVREIDRERAVTRPPQGTTIARGRERNRANDAPSASVRGRDDAPARGDRSGVNDDQARGSERGRSAEVQGRDDGAPDGSGRGGSGRGSEARGSVLDAERDPVRNPRGSPVNGTDDPLRDIRTSPSGNFVNDRGVLDGRTPSVLEPRPLVVEEPKGTVDGGRPGEPSPASGVRPRGDVGDNVRGDDDRVPYIDDQRPRKQYPENPDRVRPLTERPDLAPLDPPGRAYVPGASRTPATRQPTGPAFDGGVPSRMPSDDRPMERAPTTSRPTGPAFDGRGPSRVPSDDRSMERAPTTSRPTGPAFDGRAPAPSRMPAGSSGSRGPAVNQQPQPEAQGPAPGKKEGKKSPAKSQGKTTPRR